MNKMTLKDFIKVLETEIRRELPISTVGDDSALKLGITNAILNLDAQGYGVYKMYEGGTTRAGVSAEDFYNK